MLPHESLPTVGVKIYINIYIHKSHIFTTKVSLIVLLRLRTSVASWVWSPWCQEGPLWSSYTVTGHQNPGNVFFPHSGALMPALGVSIGLYVCVYSMCTCVCALCVCVFVCLFTHDYVCVPSCVCDRVRTSKNVSVHVYKCCLCVLLWILLRKMKTSVCILRQVWCSGSQKLLSDSIYLVQVHHHLPLMSDSGHCKTVTVLFLKMEKKM